MIIRCFLILVLVGFIGSTQAVTIKLATEAPTNTSWHLSLAKLASEWIKISEGDINVKIFPGGIAGNEEDMIRKIRVGQLHGATLTIVGAGRIYSGVQVLSWPRLFHNTQEIAFVLKETAPFFNQKIEEKGFVPVLWTFLGWSHIFSRNPVYTNSDLMQQKLKISDVQEDEIRVWQKAGFNVVPLPNTENMMALQTGMIDAYITSPTAAMAFQWFSNTPYMNDIRFAPLFATVVLSKKTWDMIPEKYHEDFLSAASTTAEELMKSTKAMDQNTINTMVSYGLQIQKSSPEIEQHWDQMIEEYFYPALIQTDIIDSSAYEHVKEALARYYDEVN